MPQFPALLQSPHKPRPTYMYSGSTACTQTLIVIDHIIVIVVCQVSTRERLSSRATRRCYTEIALTRETVVVMMKLIIDASLTHPPSLSRRDSLHGTIRYVDQSDEDCVAQFFWSPEPLQFGDQVEFQVCSRTYDRLVYAADIRVLEKAKDIRFRVGGWVGSAP